MRQSSGLSIFFLSCLLSTAGLVSCNGNKGTAPVKNKGPRILNAEGIIVMPQIFQTDYAATGTLLPNEEVSVMPEVQGRITKISFKEGSIVKQGQVLVNLYNEDIKAQLQKLRAQRDLQIKIRDRQAELLNIGGISRQDYETTVTTIAGIDADIEYAGTQLRKTTIVAPFTGRAGIRNVSMGAVVTPATVITTLQQLHLLKMDFNVPEQYRSELSTGKDVQFTVSGSQDTFLAKISAVEPMANASTRTVRVRAIVENGQNVLAPGAFTHIIVPFDENADALLVPSQSVIPTNREKVVAVIRGGKAQMIPVRTGARTSDKVEIISGLSKGDTILTTGIMQVKPGMDVQVTVM